MKSDTKRAKSSSFLVSGPVLGGLAAGLALALRLDAVLMAGLCLFFLLLGLVCRFWCARATEQMGFRMECTKKRLIPGQ